MSEPPPAAPPREISGSPSVPFRAGRRVAALAWGLILSVSACSLLVFYRMGVTDIYGDAIAHMEGARRIFDSLTPGYAEIGTVWLPLFHLIVSPLAQSDFLWRTGLAGSLVSMACFALTAWFLFRLGFEMNLSIEAGVVTLAGFVLCPGMLYLASQPMTEPMAMLWAVLAVYGLSRYQMSGGALPLVLAALAAFAGTLTRYDEWYVLPFAALFVFLARPEAWRDRIRHAILFSVIAGAGPALWIMHNAYRFGDPLEFYNGPGSAAAIYARQLATTGFRYPTDGSLVISARYYLEDLRLVVGPWSLELAVLGLIALLADRKRLKQKAAGLLLLVSLPFYIHAMAHAAIPLYVPAFFPFTYYNLRYGLELLPALALMPSFAISPGVRPRTCQAFAAIFVALLAWQGFARALPGLRRLPLVRESILNTPCKSPLEQAVIAFLRRHYDGGTVVMAAGEWPCVAPSVGIDYRKILTEDNRRYWRRLESDPQSVTEWIVRADGDAMDELMRAHPAVFANFVLVERASLPHGAAVAIYRRPVAP